LLREHDVDEEGTDIVDARYVAEVLSGDWGFYYTVVMNLRKLGKFAESFAPFSEQDSAVVNGRIEQLVARIEREPKSLRWKMRSRIGTRVQWYEDVEEVVR
jgi:hypothetical protein